jgi:hypothetical protein
MRRRLWMFLIVGALHAAVWGESHLPTTPTMRTKACTARYGSLGALK